MQRFYYNLLFSLYHVEQAGREGGWRVPGEFSNSPNAFDISCLHPILMLSKNVISVDDVDDIFATGPLK